MTKSGGEVHCAAAAGGPGVPGSMALGSLAGGFLGLGDRLAYLISPDDVRELLAQANPCPAAAAACSSSSPGAPVDGPSSQTRTSTGARAGHPKSGPSAQAQQQRSQANAYQQERADTAAIGQGQ